MRLFRRGEPGKNEIAAFWAWWAASRDEIASAIEAGSAPAWAGQISRNVSAVHKRLAWELAPGATARHAMIVTPEGDPEIRPTALAWASAAPEADAIWEYHPSRQPGAEGFVLVLGEARVDLDEVRAIAGWDDQHELLDVRLWHPAFPSLDQGQRRQAAFLFLDHLLGEDAVERWIGAIDILDDPTGGRTPAELRAEVDRQRGTATGQCWVVAQGTDERGEHVVVNANAALKRIDLPFDDHHLAVAIQLPGSLDEATSAALNDEEDRLLAALEGTAVFAGRRTQAGRRTLHFVTATPEEAKAIAEPWARSLPSRRIAIEARRDPRWAFREQLLGG
jgi:hypothetical protein